MGYPWSEADATLIGREVSAVNGTLTNLNRPMNKGGPTSYAVFSSSWLPRVLPPSETASMFFGLDGAKFTPGAGSEHLYIERPGSLVVTSSGRLLFFSLRTLVFEADRESAELRPSLNGPLVFDLHSGDEVALAIRSKDVRRAIIAAWFGLPFLQRMDAEREAAQPSVGVGASGVPGSTKSNSGSGWLLALVGAVCVFIGANSLAAQAPLIEGVPLLHTPITVRPFWRELLDYFLVVGGALVGLAGLARVVGSESAD